MFLSFFFFKLSSLPLSIWHFLAFVLLKTAPFHMMEPLPQGDSPAFESQTKTTIGFIERRQ